jgi:catechol 2,3-dioxygenase-like lactoylglutathione lyase family enzyme
LFIENDKSLFQGKTLNHVTLQVSDVARSKKFYQQLLDLPVKTEDSTYCDLGLGGSFLGIYKDEANNPRSDHFCIGIQSYKAEAVFEKLKKEFPECKPTLEYKDQVYLRDPDDIKLQLCAVDYKQN